MTSPQQPRRQETPPDVPGLWLRSSPYFTAAACIFTACRCGPGGTETRLLDAEDNYPSDLHFDGVVWEGPYAIPSLEAAGEAERLRGAATWFFRELDDIAYYSGTPDGTYRRLTQEMADLLRAALSPAPKDAGAPS